MTCRHCGGSSQCDCSACDGGKCSLCDWAGLSDLQKRTELDRLAPKDTPVKKKAKRTSHAATVKLTQEERARRRQEYEEDSARWQIYWETVSKIPSSDLESWVAVPLPPPRGGVMEAKIERETVRESPPEFRAAMFLRWSKALEAHEAEIEALGMTISRRLTLRRLQELVEENAAPEPNEEPKL